jgi:hypothetical protein
MLIRKFCSIKSYLISCNEKKSKNIIEVGRYPTTYLVVISYFEFPFSLSLSFLLPLPFSLSLPLSLSLLQPSLSLASLVSRVSSLECTLTFGYVLRSKYERQILFSINWQLILIIRISPLSDCPLEVPT